jgi:hypothetical protein
MCGCADMQICKWKNIEQMNKEHRMMKEKTELKNPKHKTQNPK